MPVDSEDHMQRRTALAGMWVRFSERFSRLAFLAANAPSVFGAFKRHANIAYGPDPQQQLDVYVPTTAAGPRPVVVFWHGGSWRQGDKADYRFVGAALAESGYVAVVANYRHYPQVKMPGYMSDAAQAARWAAAHAAEFGGAPERLYLMGHSAGAHLAALVTLDARYFTAAGGPAPRIAGVIGLSGPYDFLPLSNPDDQEMFGPPPIYPVVPYRIRRASAGIPPTTN
jgi:acetyl esterase/lipase